MAEGEAFLDEVLLLSRLLGLTFFEPALSNRQANDLIGQETTVCGQEGMGESDSGSG
jgi:hypothetical protein